MRIDQAKCVHQLCALPRGVEYMHPHCLSTAAVFSQLNNELPHLTINRKRREWPLHQMSVRTVAEENNKVLSNKVSPVGWHSFALSFPTRITLGSGGASGHLSAASVPTITPCSRQACCSPIQRHPRGVETNIKHLNQDCWPPASDKLYRPYFIHPQGWHVEPDGEEAPGSTDPWLGEGDAS